MLSKTSHTSSITVPVIAIALLILIPVVFWGSLILLKAYTGGDQVHYRLLYDELAGASLSEMPIIIFLRVTSFEPFTGLILWLGANLMIEKDVFISILNTILVVKLVLLMHRYKAPWPIVFLLLTNFYLIVLLTSAERLKIAYIVLVFAASSAGFLRYLLFCASPFAHLKSILILISIFIAKQEDMLKKIFLRLRFSKREFLFLIGSLLIGLVVLLFLRDGVLRKVTSYAEAENSSSEFVNMVFLFIIAILVTHRRFRMVLALLPLFIVMYSFGQSGGGSMLAISVVIFFLLEEGRLGHPLVYALMLFFSFKSIPYVYNIFAYGDGFMDQQRLLDLIINS